VSGQFIHKTWHNTSVLHVRRQGWPARGSTCLLFSGHAPSRHKSSVFFRRVQSCSAGWMHKDM
jgi:hypothetical protein